MTFNYSENHKGRISNTPFVLNQDAGEKVSTKDGIIKQLSHLNMHGVKTPLTANNRFKKLKYQHMYLLAIFQQNVIGIYRQTRGTRDNWVNSSLVKNNKKIFLQKVNGFTSKREERRVKSNAVQAVYALGLDYALVKVGVSAGTRPWVLFVNPNPETNAEINNLFDKAIEDFTSKWEKHVGTNSKEVILGADPEFVLQNQNNSLVLASKYLPEKGIAGCDQIWTNRDRSQLPLAELRPKPAKEPRDLIINLYKSMQVASKKITDRNLRWLAGGLPISGFPIGGHIHFSNIWLNTFLLRALDNYLTLSITLLEDKSGAARRPKYGFLGDYREQFHGGFEYRTPPSWLVLPSLTRGVIALAKLIAENYIYLYQNPLKDIEIQRAYYRGDKETLRPIVKSLWNELKQLNDYQLYEKYLSQFEALIDRGYVWNERSDIKRVWKLPPYHRKKGG